MAMTGLQIQKLLPKTCHHGKMGQKAWKVAHLQNPTQTVLLLTMQVNCSKASVQIRTEREQTKVADVATLFSVQLPDHDSSDARGTS